ncbi:TPA: protein phosphatase 2C domain-containing protein [Escherichia coli]|uniref:PP2C family serine/threonine-protein phosphatase n=1 Tax=Escherichia coli TaxID=562 RepID=UPI0020C73006|nr:PP2C family serine/threonine-protein phosphatase [Escherichia coli]EEW1895359.1 protein phosphatase 2C domain-containing protein [Escherichia coli]EHL7842190.1 protein phosphatase 2C domain-containing protein [Escherichia coli]MCA7508332.1 protein phosphatase 2C domain-containing protein [Escherichia coli]UTJ21757.1 protein phosphatase 2C domain-containing protein [Escherichia coli]WFZ90645.1 protein phosphatase 2C domain-containing protein [Escherichia coli]
MSQNALLEEKIIRLVLSELGHPVEGERLFLLSHAPSLTEEIMRLKERIESLAQGLSARVSEGDNDAEIAASSASSLSDQQQTVVSDADNPGIDATDTPLLQPLPENEPHPPFWKLMPYYEFDKPAQRENENLSSLVLKPGQIPTGQQRARLAVPPVVPPRAKIIIPNARAGERFSSPVAIVLDEGQQATVRDVVFPRNIGLTFDKEHKLLTGTPTENGDIELSVLWSCASHDECETKQLFIVNPDPRSLWKVVEPPADASYPKSHLDAAGLVRGDIRIAAASRRGRSHEHAGSFRDDDFYINHCQETGWSVMLVADGAGSAVNSREGSRIAVQTAGDYLFNQLSGLKGVHLKQHITAWEGSDQLATIKAMLHHFKQAATLAVNSIQNEAICAEQPVKSYSTTLLATVALRTDKELFAAAFWLGDGAIGAYSPSGKVRILGNPDSGEYAGQTRFLDQSIIADPSFSGRISVGKWNDVSHLILMTDGVSDPLFETDNGLRSDEKWTRLLDELIPVLTDASIAPERLGDWLNFFSTGNHDDRTIAVLW